MRKYTITLALTAWAAFSAPLVNLSIQENAGVARTGEDVTMGVPLPENGFYTNAALFTLRDQSNAIIPCEIKAVATWVKNPTHIRWLQLNFPYSLGANQTQTVTLTSETSPYTLTSKLHAADMGTYFEVTTGKIKFQVKKANFNLLDQVWVDESGSENYNTANQVVSSHTRGLIHYLSNAEFTSSNDAASTVTLERSGPGVVTLKAMGMLKNSGGTGTFNFITRIYAYNNSQTVKIYSSIEYQTLTVTSTINLQGLHEEIPLTLGGTRTAVVGKPGTFAQTTLTSGQDAFCMVARPSSSVTSMGSTINGTFGGAITPGTFDPKSSKPKDIGWVSLSDGARGCAVSLRYFWQMVPASVEALGNGTLIAGLYPKRSGAIPLPIYAGVARSHETRWMFFNTGSADVQRSKAVSGTNRLYALASPYWYTRRTSAVVKLVEKNQALYTSSNWSTISGWDTKMNNTWNTILSSDNNWLGMDAYGFLEWGDNPHYNQGGTPPWDMLWNGNYYGLDIFAFEHFFRTGDRNFFDYGVAHAQYMEDVHQVHFGPTQAVTGGNRYSPAANHIATEDGTPTIDNMSHHHTEAMFVDYYMTGNDRAIDMAMEGATYCQRQGFTYATGPSQNIDTYIRRWAHDMYSVVMGYEYNHNPAWFNTLWQNWEIFRRNIVNPASTIGQPFMVGLGMEAVVKMYNILSPTYKTNTGAIKPDSIAHYLKIWCDKVDPWPTGTGSAQINANTTIGYAFLSQFYGNGYLTTAANKAALLPSTPNNLHKDYAQQARNLEMSMYYFAIPESLQVATVGTEQKSPLTVEAGASLSAQPSPFRNGTRIIISGVDPREFKAHPYCLKVYSANGQMVKDLTLGLDPASLSVQWNTRALPAGVYFLRFKAGGGRTVNRSVTLLQ